MDTTFAGAHITAIGGSEAQLPSPSLLQEQHAVKDEQLLKRITCNPGVMKGKPVIRGTRLTVEYILNLRAHGASEEEILMEYTGLTIEDIQACYLVASKSLEKSMFLPLMLETA